MIEIWYKGKHLINIYGKDTSIVFVDDEENIEVKE